MGKVSCAYLRCRVNSNGECHATHIPLDENGRCHRAPIPEGTLFIRHIEKHLEDDNKLRGQHVICKICGKSVGQIAEEEGR